MDFKKCVRFPAQKTAKAAKKITKQMYLVQFNYNSAPK